MQQHSPPSLVTEVLIVDAWSDRNRGDAAMQIALVSMVRQRIPGAHVALMTAYGANQWPAFLVELDETGPLVDKIVGGLGPTAYPLGMDGRQATSRRRAANLAALLVGLLLIPVWVLLRFAACFEALLPAPYRASIRALRSADLVIWNGRNFRANTTSREPLDIWRLVYNPLIAMAFGKPVACVGASVWPLRHALARRLLRGVLGHADFVSLREAESFRYAGALLNARPARVELLPDLSLALLGHAPRKRRRPSNPKRIGLTIVDWQGSGAAALVRYEAAIREYVTELLQDDGVEVVVIPQVTFGPEETSRLIANIGSARHSARFTIIEGRPTVRELTEIYAGLDILIATRMHSAIFALSRGVPVVTIPYDAGAKWGILDMMGVEQVSIPFEAITAEALRVKVAEVWTRRAKIRESVSEELPRLARLASGHVDIPVQMLGDRPRQ